MTEPTKEAVAAAVADLETTYASPGEWRHGRTVEVTGRHLRIVLDALTASEAQAAAEDARIAELEAVCLDEYELAPLGAGDGEPWEYTELRDYWNEMVPKWSALQRRMSTLEAENAKLREALTKIKAWEMPPTDRIWNDVQGAARNETPMPYRAIYGTDGEQEVIREIARAALVTP